MGRRVVLLQQFRRALRELGVAGRIVATDLSSTTAAMQEADEAIEFPRIGDADYLPKLLRVVEDRQIGLLVPLTDLDLQLLADAREQFARRGCVVMIGSSEAVATCRDKGQFHAAVAAAGLAVGRCVSLAEFRKAPFFPCFAKPVDGSASIGAACIASETALQRHVARYGEELVIQDVHDGREYTIDVYRTRAGEIKAVVPRQRLVVRSGEVEQGVTVNDAQLIAAARRLVESMDGLWGVMCCQCRRDDGGAAYFFELNPRFGGGAPLSIAAGADLPAYLLQDVLGREVGGTVGEFRENLMLMRYPGTMCFPVADPARLPGFDTPIFK